MVRKLSLIALVLVVLYALAGSLILPWWLERAIPERLDRHMGWQATVDDVQVNPFAMSIEATGLAAQDGDGEPVLGFERVYVNLGIVRLVTGIVAVQNFELDQPFIRLDLGADYNVNLVRDWQAHQPPAGQPAATEAEPSESVKLFLDRVRIAGGEVLFRDFSQSEPEQFQVSPLDLSLDDLATWPSADTESSYALLAAIGGQTVEWEGDLTLAPLYSAGYLRVADVSHATLAHFLKPYLPYALRDGSVTVSSNYEIRSGEQFALSTSGGEVTVTDLALGMAGDRDGELFRSERIHIPDIAFGLINRQVSVGPVTVDAPLLDLERDRDGLLNLLTPFVGDDGATDDADSQTASGAMPFRWSVTGVALNNGEVNWRDRQPVTAADLTLEGLNLSLGRLSQDLAEPVDYDADLALAEGGRISLRGQTTPQPFTLEAAMSIADLKLTQLNPYLGDTTNLRLADGLLSLDGNLDLDNQKSPLTGTFSGNGQIVALDLRFADSGSALMSWQNVRLEPLEYNLSPARLEIGTLTLAEPRLNVVRGQDGRHNLTRILAVDEEPSAEPQPAGEASPATEGEGLIFRIGQILLESGGVFYADRTLDPVFSTRIDRLNGSVTGLSNVPPQQGKVSMQGRVGDLASLKLDGSIGALGTDEVSRLALKLDDVSLPTLSPYLGRYLGYGIQSGKLGLDLDYQIAGTRIDAANNIFLDRMELGDTITSEQAVNAPVKLGLALLRDGDGVIDISLPIQGDLADPQFSVAPVIMGTFVNLVAKAAISPFSMLGSLADMTGLTGEELGYVSFKPGKVEMAAGGQDKLEVLSTALEKRPGLVLKVRGAVSPEVDGDSLRRQQLAEQLGISQLPAAEDRLARLESQYQQAGFEQPLAAYRQEIAGGASADSATLDTRAWETALVNRLVTRVALAPEVLEDLARSRGVRLAKTLQEDFAVPDSQLFLLEPLQNAERDDRGAVKANFELEAR